VRGNRYPNTRDPLWLTRHSPLRPPIARRQQVGSSQPSTRRTIEAPLVPPQHFTFIFHPADSLFFLRFCEGNGSFRWIFFSLFLLRLLELSFSNLFCPTSRTATSAIVSLSSPDLGGPTPFSLIIVRVLIRSECHEYFPLFSPPPDFLFRRHLFPPFPSRIDRFSQILHFCLAPDGKTMRRLAELTNPSPPSRPHHH